MGESTAERLRERQAPLKAKYRADPGSGVVRFRATGRLADDMVCAVDTGGGTARAGLHPAAGGDGLTVCSGDMLLQALAGCAGVTLASVAAAMNVDIRGGTVDVEADLDFRGTLAVAKDVPVGFHDIKVEFSLDTDATADQLDTLIRLTERYCVVLQTIATTPALSVAWSTTGS